MTCEEAQELITGLVDRDLIDPERGSLESHLQGCPSCRVALEQEQMLKQTIRGRVERMRAPSTLRDRILSDRRVFPEKTRMRWQDYVWPIPRLVRPALAACLVLAIVLPVFLLLKPTKESIPVAALNTYDLFARGELAVLRTDNPNEIAEQLTRAVDGHFHPMGYDFTAMRLRPVAGLLREVQGRKILVAIYQGQGGTLFCYTFFGSEKDAPPNSARFFDTAKKINFYAFSRGAVNAVFHREGDIICILAAEMPMDELVALAKSKAKPS